MASSSPWPRSSAEAFLSRDESDQHTINAEPFADLLWANWAPDSRHLAVIAGTKAGKRVTLLDAVGREAPRVLVPDMEVDTLAFRPPNGDEIAFRALVGDLYGIFVMKADGTNIRPLQSPGVPRR